MELFFPARLDVAKRKQMLDWIYVGFNAGRARPGTGSGKIFSPTAIRPFQAETFRQVIEVFRISKSKAPSTASPNTHSAVVESFEISKFCATENWTGDLSNGLFQIGKVGSYFHGLDEGECGLLTLLRCYEPNDRVSILELLENASSSPSSFCFSTFIVAGPGERQPLMCVGESTGFIETAHGSMHGVFVFPRVVHDALGTH